MCTAEEIKQMSIEEIINHIGILEEEVAMLHDDINRQEIIINGLIALINRGKRND